MSPRAAVSALVSMGVFAIAALAATDALWGGEEPPAALAGATPASGEVVRGPDVPPPGALEGTLYLTSGDDCRLRSLDLERLALGPPGPATACRIWASPAGDRAVVARRSGERWGRGLWLVRLGDPPRLERPLGPARGTPAWSPGGTAVAWCGTDGETVVLELPTGASTRAAGCFPLYLSSGELVTRPGRGVPVVVSGGRPMLDADDLATAFRGDPGTPRIVGAGAGDDGRFALAVFATHLGTVRGASLELWRDGRLEEALPIPEWYARPVQFYGVRIELGPSGAEAAFVFPEDGVRPLAESLVALVDLRTGESAPDIARSPYAGLAWSPDGGWLAVSTGSEILIFGDDRTSPVYVLPVESRAIAWVGEPDAVASGAEGEREDVVTGG